MRDPYRCGPLEVWVEADGALLREKVASQLHLFNVPWSEPRTSIDLDVRESDEAVATREGNYLVCARMRVDVNGSVLVAACPSGACCEQSADGRSWHMRVPRRPADIWTLTDIESLLSLVLTTGWRALGWVPVHSGTIVKDGHCAILCAESGGGKTSLTAAMIRRGFCTLGDDKLLLRIGDDGAPELRALVHTFNLHPKTREWFPEVGDLERLPTYSEWTEKRKVHPEAIWPGRTLTHARPTHLLQLARREEASGIAIGPLSQSEVVSILLHQTVVPSERETAGRILAAVVTTARSLRGFRVEIGENAYREEGCLEPVEAAMS